MLGDQHDTLNSDVLLMATRVSEDSSQANRRALVHAVSAYIEGCAYGLRQTTLGVDDDLRVLSDGERAVLGEISYRLDQKGSVHEAASYQRFEQTLLFSVRAFAKVHGALSYAPDTSDQRWRAVKHFITLRNRVTHPESAADLDCADEDIDNLLMAFDWFHDTILEIGKERGLTKNICE